MDDKTARSLLWALVFKGAVSLICFTVLAIVFHHWWIVFFAILFLPNSYD